MSKFPYFARKSSCSLVVAARASSAAAFSTVPVWPWLAVADSSEVAGIVSLVAGHSAAVPGAAVPAVAVDSVEPVAVIVAEPLPAELGEFAGAEDSASTVVAASPDETEVAESSVVEHWIAGTAYHFQGVLEGPVVVEV